MTDPRETITELRGTLMAARNALNDAARWIEEPSRVPTSDAQYLREMARVIERTLDANPNPARVAMTLRPAPCDCIKRIGGSWHQECYCQNNGDLADAQAWCTEANIRGAQHDD